MTCSHPKKMEVYDHFSWSKVKDVGLDIYAYIFQPIFTYPYMYLHICQQMEYRNVW